jgi:hypothetical protein
MAKTYTITWSIEQSGGSWRVYMRSSLWEPTDTPSPRSDAYPSLEAALASVTPSYPRQHWHPSASGGSECVILYDAKTRRPIGFR